MLAETPGFSWAPRWRTKKERRKDFAFVVTILVTMASTVSSSPVVLEAHLSQHEVKGVVRFEQSDQGGPVRIQAELNVAKNYEGEYSWGIYPFPVDYAAPDFCHSRNLGRTPIINLDSKLNKLQLNNESASASDAVISVARRYSVSGFDLVGKDGVWGHGLVLEGPARARACASLMPASSDKMRSAEARFTSSVAGSVWFTTLSRTGLVETKIFTSLYRATGNSPKTSSHKWQIFITDVLDTDSDIRGGGCDFLQNVYDSKGPGSNGIRDGDLEAKFGKVKVGQRPSMFTKAYLHDVNLELQHEGARSLFLVLYDEDHTDSFLACARLRDVRPRVGVASFGHEGMAGHVRFAQPSPFFPTRVSVSLSGLDSRAGSFHVHNYPLVLAPRDPQDNPCGRTGGHFNPFNVDPVPGSESRMSFDRFEVGDLSGKYGGLVGKDEYSVDLFDPSISLFGTNSIIGRSIVVHNSPKPTRWTCANILLKARKPLVTAVATFTYPISGRIVFRQDESDPHSDTQVIVESLLYSDGTKNDTSGHKWHVHVNIPGRDYFNWTGRCLSAGGHYNPYRVDLNDYRDCESNHLVSRCEVGDLVNKHGPLRVVGRKRNLARTAQFFTDSNLPLSGPDSIVDRSIVVHDDNAPKHRGNRMACTQIKRLYRHKAVANSWFGNGQTVPVKGRIEMVQASPMDPARILVDLYGLNGVANAYHVHRVAVQEQLAFPCTGDAIGGHFNPYEFDPSASPRNDGTDDQYEVGDLSGKYGRLEGAQEVKDIHNDTNLPLFGYNSILGRSIVIHKKHRGLRWACASLGWGFDPDEAREVRAIASFHHPNGFAWGYIRFRQVIYNDGGATDTTIEVRLKHPGKFNTDVTQGHDWSVYVNPVGHDASVDFLVARCTAAGYRWNPTHIQLADPNDRGFYGEQCGPDTPLRCEVGDLSGRHGQISVGGKATVFNDPHLLLDGDDWFTSVIGKSIVVHGANGASGERFACANIEADREIVKVASVRSKSRFNLDTFLEEVRAIMGVPEWFLYIDARKTRKLHNGRCVQLEIHFAGPHAHKLEQDFGRLMRTGRLGSISIPIPGYVPDPNRKTKLGYTECDSDPRNSRPTLPRFGLGTSGSVQTATLSSTSVAALLGLLVYVHMW